MERVGFINRTGRVYLFVNKPHLGTSIKIKGNGGLTSRVGFRQVGFINPTLGLYSFTLLGPASVQSTLVRYEGPIICFPDF